MIENNLNLESQIAAITALDCIISNSLYENNEISEDSTHCEIIKSLFDNNINPQTSKDKNEVHQYIYQSFQSFVAHKEKIEIRMDCVDENLKEKELLQLLFDDFVKKEDKKDVSSWFAENGNENMIKYCLFEVFKNVKQIYIYERYYPFSLLEFLSRIENTSINKVTIYVRSDTRSSIQSSSYFDTIKSKYTAKQIEINIY